LLAPAALTSFFFPFLEKSFRVLPKAPERPFFSFQAGKLFPRTPSFFFPDFFFPFGCQEETLSFFSLPLLPIPEPPFFMLFPPWKIQLLLPVSAISSSLLSLFWAAIRFLVAGFQRTIPLFHPSFLGIISDWVISRSIPSPSHCLKPTKLFFFFLLVTRIE